jgi:hypothetical protein
MSTPSWQQREDEENLEIERVLHEQGEREAEELSDYRLWQHGDPLGLEDGRPGLSWGINPFGGSRLFIPRMWRFYLNLGLSLAFILAVLLLRFCVLR